MRLLFLLIGFFATCSFLGGCPAWSSPRMAAQDSPEGNSESGLGLLPQGIAIGDVSSRRAFLWVRTNGAAVVRVEWAPLSVGEQASTAVTASRTALLKTGAETDYTLTVPLEGLTPSTRYWYHVLVGPAESTVRQLPETPTAMGEFITPPDQRTSAAVSFAWSGDLGSGGRCRRGADGYPIFDVIPRYHPDFFLFLGDTIYGDHVCPSPPNEPGADFKATTLDDYRLRHRYQRGAASLQRFLAGTPVYVVWDDHEVRNNFAGPYDEQMRAGRQALREYWPIASPLEDLHRLYRTVRYGADLELFILDVRQYRNRNVDQDSASKTMLGRAQLAWLLNGLQTSTATWKVIATPVPLSIPKGGDSSVPGNDGWAGGLDGTGFERERQVIVDTILGRKIKNVVFLSGDVHWAQANAYDPNQDGVVDFHEYIAGPLSAPSGRFAPTQTVLHPTELFYETGYHNFGLVRATKEDFHVSVVDEAGQERVSHRIVAQ
ncbi:MAG: alkaline phosphatase D family protein [Nitrospira sp.]|nr:alkaline phosphatase D family protein [Nitrospira sp.]MDH4304681.1 alkaline phosphatase D family protein [Nitrospira sp.]MDH5192901.1 alkaline phosphatase D family protein [Nitrospira sp.]